MENLFGAIAFTLFIVAQFAAVVYVHRMKHPLSEKYAANNDMAARSGAPAKRAAKNGVRTGTKAAQPA